MYTVTWTSMDGHYNEIKHKKRRKTPEGVAKLLFNEGLDEGVGVSVTNSDGKPVNISNLLTQFEPEWPEYGEPVECW